jgi:hypothetical protein
MKSHKSNLHELLNEVIPASAEHCGPGNNQILAMLRTERSRRKRRRVLYSVTAILAAGSFFLSNVQRSNPEPRIVHTTHEPRIVFKSVDDDELLGLLHETPAAIMELPNGDRTLLVVAQY